MMEEGLRTSKMETIRRIKMGELTGEAKQINDAFQRGEEVECDGCGETFTKGDNCLHLDILADGSVEKYCSDCYNA